MKKFIFWISVILSVYIIIIAFMPLLKSPIGSLGWSTIFIASVPGLLTLITTISALTNRTLGGGMFIILSAVFGYFIYTKLLSSDYLTISVLFLLAGILFLVSNRPQKTISENNVLRSHS